MEWSHELCLNLINKYKEREVLWNPRHPGYNSKIKKDNAWKEIAIELVKPMDEVKKKMESLKGSYRREKTRLRKSVARKKGKDETYTSKWFAYEALQFLSDKDEPRKTNNDLDFSDNEELLSCEGEESSQVNEEQGGSTSNSAEISENGIENAELPIPEIQIISEPFPKKLQNLKRKATDEDPIIAEAFTYLKETVTAVKKPKDRCSLFGELVAEKLRLFDNKRMAIAEQKINTILFEMEMSSYGYDHIL